MQDALVITCEHGGNTVPPEFASLFANQQAVLNSHRGWDPGALELAEQISRAFNAPLYSSTITRLLVDLNRSQGHKYLHASQVKLLSAASKHDIIRRYYAPHRAAVFTEIDRLVAEGKTVRHLAVHSFTPELDGMVRLADVALLYDPGRSTEKLFAKKWLQILGKARGDLKVRRNYPYHGKDDGLTALLRKRIPNSHYAGIELEINQRFVVSGNWHWERLKSSVIDTLGAALDRADQNNNHRN